MENIDKLFSKGFKAIFIAIDASKSIKLNIPEELEGIYDAIELLKKVNSNEDVADAKFIITQLRGFEKFCEGRLMLEMPMITSRICGICPVNHHLASAKAVDAILGIEIPEPAKKLRLLLHMGQII